MDTLTDIGAIVSARYPEADLREPEVQLGDETEARVETDGLLMIELL